MRKIPTIIMLLALTASSLPTLAETPAPPVASAYDPVLAKQVGANENGMRRYVLVVLKTGAQRVPDGEARTEMFKGHFANMKRLADEGKLAVAGPFGDKNDWRGMFILAVDTFEEAKALVATDPVIINGEMVAEYHTLFASAALMVVNDTHKKISKNQTR